MIKFDDEQASKMRALQMELNAVLRRANDQKLEAGIAAFACIRCARTLLNFYPDAARQALLLAIIPFLEGKPAMDGDPASNILIM